MSLKASTGAPSFRAGTQPVLGVSVGTTGPTACVRDLSGPLQVFTVYTAGGSRVWSTADCFPGTGTDVRYLQPGERLQYNIRWSGTTSQPHCAGDRLTVPPGTYVLQVTIGSLKAAPATFTLS
ncbi:hypothetical protein [Nakamurella endophytica]|nr:hypothetical protein [Nakamurella endophytica]